MAVRNEFVWSEHHRRPEKCGVGKRAEDRQFAFPTFADIQRRRASISTDSRNMDEPLELPARCAWMSKGQLRRNHQSCRSQLPHPDR